MKGIIFIVFVAIAIIGLFLSGCSHEAKEHENKSSEELTTSRSEHERDSEGSGEGEESGTELTINQTYDKVRNGAHLILAYDAQSNSFKGTVENTTNKTLKKVRVEVHLSNGIELGPTKPVNLEPGKKSDVVLVATEKKFEGWSAHPEVGGNEHGNGEGEGEHGSGEGEHGSGEGEGEHGRESRDEHD